MPTKTGRIRPRPIRMWPLAVAALVAISGLGFAGYRYQENVKAFFQPPPPGEVDHPPEVVSVGGPGVVLVAGDSLLEKKLEFSSVETVPVSAPVLTVSGSVAARLGHGDGPAESRWDFASSEMAATYGDWIKARADIAFAEKQAQRVKELADARVTKLTADVTRLEKLVAIGAEAERDLAAARADKLQAEIQGQKDIHEANNIITAATRNRGLLERLLLQAGIDPESVLSTSERVVLVVADVPESKIGLVRAGQNCEACFYSFPEVHFRGRVSRIGPSVSKDRRTLRVTFELHDETGRLLPGMFADVGLGTEKRDVLTVPVQAVLHAGKHDYVLIQEEPGRFKVHEVDVEEPLPVSAPMPHNAQNRIVVKSGIHRGDRVIADGAILLKPVVVRSLGDAIHQ